MKPLIHALCGKPASLQRGYLPPYGRNGNAVWTAAAHTRSMTQQISRQAASAREQSRDSGGRFGAQAMAENAALRLELPGVAEARAVILSSTQVERDYYAANDRKHFGDPTSPGSQFTEVADTESLVALTYRQRGSLDGDDRDELIALGGDPKGFMAGKRYLKVQAPGVLGIKAGHEAGDDTPVTITRTKPGAPCSMVATVTEKTPVDYGVVIMGEHNVTGDPFVISTFPGKVTRPTADDRVDSLEGQTVPAGQLRQLLGADAFDTMTLNTRMQAS